MKKFLNFLFIFVCAFTLVACSKKGGDETTKITVNFETNGGSAVASTTVDSTDVASFVLPANPTKEGYVFEGWFLDQACTQSFSTLSADLDNLTLYAKWAEIGNGLSADLSFSFAVKGNIVTPAEYDEESNDIEIPAEEKNIDLSLDLRLNALVEDPEVEKLEDFKASIALTLTLEDKGDIESYGSVAVDAIASQILAAPVVLNLYIENGYAYASYGMVSYKVNIADIGEAVLAKIESEITNYGEMAGLDIDIPQEPDDAMSYLLTKVFEVIEKYQIDTDLIGNLLVKLLEFLPSAKIENGKTVYEITQADFEADIDSLFEWLDENAENICTEINNIFEEIMSSIFDFSQEEYYDEVSGNTFLLAEAGWEDSSEEFHSFTEDFENEDYGIYYAEAGVYYSNYLYAYFKVEGEADNLTLTKISYNEYKKLRIGTTTTDAYGNVYTYGGLSYTTSGGETISLTENFDKLEEDYIGYIDEDDNTFYVYATGDYIDMDAKVIYDEKAASIAESTASLKETLAEVAPALKAAIKFNKAKLELTDNSANLQFDVEFDSTELNERELMDEQVKISATATYNLQYSKTNAKVTYPDLSNAIDMTDALIYAMKIEIPTKEVGE